jgi:adenosylcobinamide kinase / adenosylcobinamide-phosphate guanylyltransferase
MSQLILVTGGARSGKSRLAERLASSFGAPLGYLATGEPRDPEMDERILRHQERRGPEWTTMEEPLRLTETLTAHDGLFRATLVDCVTLWLTNLLLAWDDPSRVMMAVREFTQIAPTLITPLVLVTNEVGMGIVPENRLARTFRDLAGEANELLAATAGEVHLVVSGIPLRLK